MLVFCKFQVVLFILLFLASLLYLAILRMGIVEMLQHLLVRFADPPFQDSPLKRSTFFEGRPVDPNTGAEIRGGNSTYRGNVCFFHLRSCGLIT